VKLPRPDRKSAQNLNKSDAASAKSRLFQLPQKCDPARLNSADGVACILLVAFLEGRQSG
jgi:hypothetical protein